MALLVPNHVHSYFSPHKVLEVQVSQVIGFPFHRWVHWGFKRSVAHSQLSETNGPPSGSDNKESACSAGDLGSILGSGRAPGGHGNPLQYCCLENPHGQRGLAGYSPWGCKVSDMTEWLSTGQHRFKPTETQNNWADLKTEYFLFLKLIQTLVYWLISMNSVRSNKGLLMLLNNKDLVFVTSTFTCQLLHGSWQVLCLGLLNWINTEEGEAQKIPSIRRCWDI